MTEEQRKIRKALDDLKARVDALERSMASQQTPMTAEEAHAENRLQPVCREWLQ